jgi:hypothetical protein
VEHQIYQQYSSVGPHNGTDVAQQYLSVRNRTSVVYCHTVLRNAVPCTVRSADWMVMCAARLLSKPRSARISGPLSQEQDSCLAGDPLYEGERTAHSDTYRCGKLPSVSQSPATWSAAHSHPRHLVLGGLKLRSAVQPGLHHRCVCHYIVKLCSENKRPVVCMERPFFARAP